MKFSPNTQKWKFLKLHKPNFNFKKLIEQKSFTPNLFTYSIQTKEAGKLTIKQLESCRKALRRGLGKSSIILFPIQIGTPVSKKPLAARMGKGKGNTIACWVAIVRAGRILLEVKSPLSKYQTEVILQKAQHKLPIKTKIITLYF